MNVQQYQILTEKGFDKELIQVLEEVFQNKEKALVSQGDLEVTKLALQKEIEEVRREIEELRVEIREVELRLTKEIAEVKLTLQKEIEEVKLTLQKEIEEVRVEIREVELRLTKEIHRSNFKMVWVMLGLLSPMYIGILSMVLKSFFCDIGNPSTRSRE